MTNGTILTKYKYYQEDRLTKDEYDHLNKEQQRAVRSASGCLTSQPDSGFVFSWVHMVRRAMKEPKYMGKIMTFDWEVHRHYEDSILVYAKDYIRRFRHSGMTPGSMDFVSGGRIMLSCLDPPVSQIGVHVKEILIDVRTSIKKPITEILRKRV